MSKINLTPNASGTGVFTIASPNSNTDYTINLPEISGGEFVATDSSGNVGIGTSSPVALLHINETATTGTDQDVFRASTASGGGFNITCSDLSLSNPEWKLRTFASEPLTFQVGLTEAMRIDSSGNLLVGDTSSIGLGVLEVTSPSSGRAHEFYKEETITTSTLGTWRSNVGGTKTTVAQVKVDGDFENTNNSYGAISDIAYKENIVDASPQLDDIMAMRVRSYNLKSTGARHIGVIAQELEETSPELVKTDEEGMKSVKYSVMYMKAIKALQEAVAKIEDLESRLSAVEAN